MSDLATGVIGLGAILILILAGIPIGVVLGGVSFFGIWSIVGFGSAWHTLAAVPFDFTAHWTLSSVPMFLLMGFICANCGLSEGLFRAARSWLSFLPGGLAIASITGAAGFSALTGSSVACAAAMGRIAVPEMLKAGYQPALSAGSVAAAGTIGSLIPPSIIMIVYGVLAEVSVSKLFLAGILPGILTAALYSALVIVRVSRNPSLAPRLARPPTLREKVDCLGDVWPVLLVIAGTFGGLFAGIFTATEAGAAGVFFASLVAILKRRLTLQAARLSIAETLDSTVAIFVIAIGAALLTKFLALSGLPTALTGAVTLLGDNPLLVVAALSLVYVFLGMFLDSLGMMLLTMPVFLPLVTALDIDPIWFCIILIKYIEIGLISPPVGLNVFAIKGTVGARIATERIFAGAAWFILAEIVVIVCLVAFPQIVLFLPGLQD